MIKELCQGLGNLSVVSTW